MAQLQWPGEDPVGKQIRVGLSPGVASTVAGVVQDVRIVTLNEPREPQLYVPFAQISPAAKSIVVRADGDPSRVVSEIRQAVAAVDPKPDAVRRPADGAPNRDGPRRQRCCQPDYVAVRSHRAVPGRHRIYGVISYSVATRKREIGVPMALGAGRPTVVFMVLRQGLRLTSIGVAAGLVFSMAARCLLSALFEVSPRDAAIDPAITLC